MLKIKELIKKWTAKIREWFDKCVTSIKEYIIYLLPKTCKLIVEVHDYLKTQLIDYRRLMLSVWLFILLKFMWLVVFTYNSLKILKLVLTQLFIAIMNKNKNNDLMIIYNLLKEHHNFWNSSLIRYYSIFKKNWKSDKSILDMLKEFSYFCWEYFTTYMKSIILFILTVVCTVLTTYILIAARDYYADFYYPIDFDITELFSGTRVIFTDDPARLNAAPTDTGIEYRTFPTDAEIRAMIKKTNNGYTLKEMKAILEKFRL